MPAIRGSCLCGGVKYEITGPLLAPANCHCTFTHKYPGGYPTNETLEKLYDERDFQRAVQAYLWAVPAVSFYGAKRVLMEPKGATYGDFTPFTKFATLSHFLTPNVTTPYTLSWFRISRK